MEAVGHVSNTFVTVFFFFLLYFVFAQAIAFSTNFFHFIFFSLLLRIFVYQFAIYPIYLMECCHARYYSWTCEHVLV